MQLREIMSGHVQDIPPTASLQEAAEQMRRLDVGALPVCENRKLVGIVTDRDITVRATADGANPREAKVRDAMSGDLCFCFEDDDVKSAIKLMEEKQIRRLPVLNRSNQLIGIVSLGDLATRQGDEKLSGEVLQQISEPTHA